MPPTEALAVLGKSDRTCRTCSVRPVVGQWADDARRAKLLLAGRFAFPDGVRAAPSQRATTNFAGPAVPRPVIITWLHCMSFCFAVKVLAPLALIHSRTMHVLADFLLPCCPLVGPDGTLKAQGLKSDSIADAVSQALSGPFHK
jgi:hypothetical protein